MDAFQIEHYSELLDRLVAEGRLRPTSQVAGIVTYHDPCYLGRHNHIYEPPRRILRSIPGLELVEMSSNRAGSMCCGSGSGNAWENGFANKQFGVMRIREALDTGASVIATACPYCIRMLNEAVIELGVERQIVVRDVAELLLQSLAMTAEAYPADDIGVEIDQEVCHV
jgi:Fe-S oxidoreductase